MTAPRIGVDIGGTKVDAVVLSAEGVVVARQRRAVERGARGVVATASAAIADVAAQAEVALDATSRVGVGIPGAVNEGVVRHALNLDIDELDLAAALATATGAQVVVENDVNAAALGAWHVADRSVNSLAYLNLGTGLAAGIILDGRLWRGARGAAGEIGHICIDPDGPVGADGLPGGLETYASGSGIAQQWPEGALSAMAAARAGDAVAVEIRRGLFYAVATAVRVLVLTLDVERVTLGGGLTGMGDELMEGVRDVVGTWEAASPFLASLDLGTRIALVDADTPVAAIGAARLEVVGG